MIINFDLNKLIQYKLSFEAWFILYCLNENNEKNLIEYVRSCRKIPTEIFYELEEKQLLFINKHLVVEGKISFSALKITVEGKDLFRIQDFDVLFKELRESYPEKVGVKPDIRRLHGDLRSCRELYKKLIKDDIKMHDLICKCAKLYYIEKKKSNSDLYMQNLVTWLRQENYKQYIEEAANLTLNLIEEGGQSEDI